MSTHLKTKSNQNLSLANRIIENNDDSLSASVHCSYYACFQFMAHILRSHFMRSEKDIKSQGSGNNEGGSHNILINEIREQLDIVNPAIGRRFNNDIQQLKGMRIRADYRNYEIKLEEAQMALSYSKNLLTVLKQNFNI